MSTSARNAADFAVFRVDEGISPYNYIILFVRFVLENSFFNRPLEPVLRGLYSALRAAMVM